MIKLVVKSFPKKRVVNIYFLTSMVLSPPVVGMVTECGFHTKICEKVGVNYFDTLITFCSIINQINHI